MMAFPAVCPLDTSLFLTLLRCILLAFVYKTVKHGGTSQDIICSTRYFNFNCTELDSFAFPLYNPSVCFSVSLQPKTSDVTCDINQPMQKKHNPLLIAIFDAETIVSS